uniref:Predicted protein n=1 Tax=Hordeum vulgare subsp. vulgare TaxID=112509 RepID=F2E313_HORVV|nr:predicted protein [Hordeum vulgare subsp. vulgare]
MGVHPGLRPQLLAKQPESPDCNGRSAIDGPTFLITVVVDDAFRARSVVQWHGFCQATLVRTSDMPATLGIFTHVLPVQLHDLEPTEGALTKRKFAHTIAG